MDNTKISEKFIYLILFSIANSSITLKDRCILFWVILTDIDPSEHS